jgi:plasmid stability protein
MNIHTCNLYIEMRTVFFSIIFLLTIANSFAQCISGPVTVTATPSSTTNMVQVNWNPVTVKSGWNVLSLNYTVYYGVGNTDSNIGSGGTTSAALFGMTYGATYSIRVRTQVTCQNIQDPSTTGNDDVFSNTVNALILPEAPIISAGSATSNSSSTISCTWNAANGASGYDIEVKDVNGITVVNATNVAGNTYLATGLSPNSSYTYRVKARNSTGASGFSANSNSVLTRPAAPTFSAGSIMNVTSTTFQVGWDAVAGSGAVTYRLDVSADQNFNSFVTQDLSVSSTTSPTITNLTPGTTYYYRVRAVNASGTSVNSLNNQVLTAPAKPANFTVTSPTATGGSVNWSSAPTATQYEIYVAKDANFNFPVSAYNPKIINAPTLTENLTGLTSSTDYFLKLRAKNGTNAFSDFIFTTFKTLTAPLLAPTFPATPEIAISTTSFQVQWNSVSGAVSYQLDVSTTPDFGSLVVANQTVNTTTSPIISNLSGGTLYYYRVRAVNSSAITSVDSEVKQILTAPITPSGFTISSSTASSLSVNWVASPTATQYQLFVSTNANFSSFLGDYGPKIINAETISEVITGLTTSTTYFLRVRAKNGTNSFSDFATTSGTPNASGGIQFNPMVPTTHMVAVPQNISVNVTGTTGSTVIKLHHKKNSETTYTQETLSLSEGTTYTTPLSDSWFDDFGMQYYFEVIDQVAQLTSSPGKISITVSNVVVPLENFGNKLTNYQIVSIPYSLPGRSKVGDVFEQVLGDYDKKRWRLFRYQNGANVEYSDGIKASDIIQGNAYWFISRDDVALSLGTGISYNDVDDRTPFVTNLKKGWNQIGNPFPHQINWQSVRLANPAITSDFLVYKKENASLTSTDIIQPFGGGFVFVDNDIQLSIPVNSGSSGGRVRNDIPDIPTDSFNWILPIQLEQGKILNSISGIGMNENATDGKDNFDQVTPPRFLDYVEMNSRHNDFPYNISRDVVDHQNEYVWEFKIESNSSDPIILKWDQTIVASRVGQLVLIDKSRNIVLDMAKLDSYSAQPDASILIQYTQDQLIEVSMMELGKPYPNPFQHGITIPYNFSSDQLLTGEFEVRDLSGQLVNHSEIKITNGSSGIYSISWDGTTSNGDKINPGMYLYQIKIIKGEESMIFKGKVIKQ